jgi:hypothetical protein
MLMGAGTVWAGGVRCTKPAEKPYSRPLYTPPSCETKPTYPVKPSYYQPPSCAPKPVCSWNISSLRSKVIEIGQLITCFQTKICTTRGIDPKIFTLAVSLVTDLIKLQCITSNCDADFERAIGCVETRLCALEEAVRCSKNYELSELFRKIKCLIKELASCKTQSCGGGYGGG